jgi:tetratricopeptide (TPR) repeat protein
VKDESIKVLQEGVNLANEDKFDEAITKFNGFVELYNPMVQAIIQRGRAHWEMRRWDKAQEDFNRAIQMDPDNSDIKWTMSLINLQIGNFAKAWETFEHRWLSKKFDSPRLKTKKPRWALGGRYKDVLVWSEQGIGDQILYCSLLREMKKHVLELTVMVDARLIPLFKRSLNGITFIPQNARVSEIDAQIPMGSIACEFIQSLDDIPRFRSDPYLIPDYSRASAIRADFNLKPGEKMVGISWVSGAPRIGNHKSASLEDLLPILRTPNTRFVSLQYGDHYKNIYELEKAHGIRIEIVPEIDNTTDIDGLASLIAACDCVVTVSNATGHIAGAIGATTFLLDSNKLWYWNSRKGRTNLWYPSVRGYRKDSAIAPWTPQVAEVTRDLSRFLNGGNQPTFVFFRTGTEDQLWYARKFVRSLRDTNPGARIIMCTDSKTPVIEGTERFELDLDCEDFMEYRLKIYSALGLNTPAMYLDDDMIVRETIDPESLLGEKKAVFCERFFDKDLYLNTTIKGVTFEEHQGKTLFQTFPFLACATVTQDHKIWGELLDILNHIDPKYRTWYGDQEAMKIWSKMNTFGTLSEADYACLPEYLSGREPKIVHYKGERKEQMR